MLVKINTMLKANSDASNVASFGKFLNAKKIDFTVKSYLDVFVFTYWTNEDAQWGS